MAVLITAAAYAGAYRLERILNIPDVFFGDQNDLPTIPGKKFIPIVAPSSNSFSHDILKTCLDNDISVIYPLHRDEIDELSRSRQLFSEYGISLIIPSEEWLKNNLNISSFCTSNLAVLEKGVIMAGNLPDTLSLPGKEESGVFSWHIMDDMIKYSLFVVENAN